MDAILQQVKEFADRAHGQQMRRYSADRYIVHPERVMNMVRKYNTELPVLAAALLHDVLEDTETTENEIADFLRTVMHRSDVEKTLQIVKDLTDVYIKKDYPHWNRRKRKLKEADRLEKASAEAHTIKYADITDNIPEITREDPDFADRYLKECHELLRRMTKGSKELREIAIQTVEGCRQELKRLISQKRL